MALTKEQQVKLEEWRQASIALAKAKIKENELRMEIFNSVFTEPKEGVNRVDIANGWKLKADYKYYRNIDEAALPAILKQLPEGSADRLVKYKPELKVRDYKALTEEQRKIFDEALVIKPGTPSLSIESPKQKGK